MRSPVKARLEIGRRPVRVRPRGSPAVAEE